jgi:hypothetical protein
MKALLPCLVLALPLIAADEVSLLPAGSAPPALETPWFPGRLHAFVWRNWQLVPAQRLAEVVGAKAEDIIAIGRSMGLEPAHGLGEEQWRRAHLTIIRRNWHLLPYGQILRLLDWKAERLAYTLREDDFFFHKVGDLKPQCEPLEYQPPSAAQQARAAEIASLVRETFPRGRLEGEEPLFAFIDRFKQPAAGRKLAPVDPDAPLRIGYSYFAPCGDPLLDPTLDAYPDGLLSRLSAAGANAVWLHVELGHLASLPWSHDGRVETRREALRALVKRAAAQGMQVFLYLNEPRSLPAKSPVFDAHPDWRGVLEKDYNALCTSVPEVRAAIREGVTSLCKAVPDLGGFFTITASENLTSCWSHGRGDGCPRCKSRTVAEVIAEVSTALQEGIRAAGTRQRYIVWDWAWRDEWALDAIRRLPEGVTLQCVSEWSLPIERGGVKTTVGEYSISSVGPGPRALKHWAAARQRGLGIAAKIQCGNTWELSAVPYIPVIENVARHASGLREAGVRDILLGWTLGGHPSPNIEVVSAILRGETLEDYARQRHGGASTAALAFWRGCSAAFREFPYHIGVVYNAPLQMGPANVLWPSPTQYHACMVGLPYDDLKAWRSIYPEQVFVQQLEKVAQGFESAVKAVRSRVGQPSAALSEETRFAEAAAIHFASVAGQARAVMARDAKDQVTLKSLCDAEARLAARLHRLQSQDSRIGFEASNQYYYVPLDLVEKVVNCRWIMEQGVNSP